ncbi:MAG: DUF2318 domain-containing protein [Clostridia bacterium]|nr:MAG: DUF2318 domain-containing protein [Clostridia bacterium]
MDTQNKKQEFLSESTRYRGPNRIVLLVFVLAAVVLVGAVYAATRSEEVPRRWQGGSYNVGYQPNYKGKVISMTDIPSRSDSGVISFSLEEVKKNSIVYTDIPGAGPVDALVAYISPAGRLVVGVAMCEPCRSQRFHIDDNILVCDTCGTRWYLNDLQGISGGCPQYPPEELPYEVEDGGVKVQTSLLKDWSPRAEVGTQVSGRN